jgi:hypothetical protein
MDILPAQGTFVELSTFISSAHGADTNYLQ